MHSLAFWSSEQLDLIYELLDPYRVDMTGDEYLFKRIIVFLFYYFDFGRTEYISKGLTPQRIIVFI